MRRSTASVHYTLVSVVTDDSGSAPRVSANSCVRSLRLSSGSVRQPDPTNSRDVAWLLPASPVQRPEEGSSARRDCRTHRHQGIGDTIVQWTHLHTYRITALHTAASTTEHLRPADELQLEML